MRCVQCGAELPQGSRFCSSCGARQPEAAAGPEAAAEAWPQARSVPGSTAEGSGEVQRSSNHAAERTQRGDDRAAERARHNDEFVPPNSDYPASRTARREESVPPDPSEPLAVRLTRQSGPASSGASRENAPDAGDPEREMPPQMRPDLPASGAARFAPPPPAAAEPRSGAADRGRVRQDRGGSSPRVWIAPPLLAICVAAALIWQVNTERGISAEAAEIQHSAVDAALGGNYEIAEAKLQQALDKRPRDPGIRSDLQTVQTIRRLDGQLTEAQRLLSRSDVDGATSILDQVNRDLSSLSGTAYDRLRDRLNKLRAKLELADIRSDAERAGTLAELTGLLKTASTYPTSEQQPVVELITDRIVEVSGNEAEQAIDEGSYYEAAAVVDEARGYAPEAQRLLDLEKQIASLTTEQEYATPELFSASGNELTEGRGDLHMDLFEQGTAGGELKFSGRLKNVSTVGMYDLLVEFRAYDAQGQFLGEDWTEVTPGDLGPGETASFSARLKAEDGAVVVIDSVSWYRE